MPPWAPERGPAHSRAAQRLHGPRPSACRALSSKRLDDLPRIQATQLSAEFQQDVDFMKAATGFVQQRDVLEDDRCLAGDLDVDLRGPPRSVPATGPC